ncbi:MAG: uracil-DNA glycosylase [Crocinitomicaceae bacterium]|jgi:uracil-DNA glycosylase|nr:uracil-DNA glycosylase [Crocinitomicaceae bacterium]
MKKVNLNDNWYNFLTSEFHRPYFEQLKLFVTKAYESNMCYPPGKEIFAAFDECSFDKLKVVIIGQDPYHGEGQANGLCFSVKDPTPHPPSLMNIFKEISSDLDLPYPNSGDLKRWATQGVLLLNATLTVEANKPGSHQKKGWETFTDAVIQKISSDKENIIFLLWGGYAKAKAKLIDKQKHYVLTSGHPSPLSANRGFWFGNKHFSQCNAILKKLNKTPIDWR